MITFFFFIPTATTETYTLSLHDALPICQPGDRSHEKGHADCRALHRQHQQRQRAGTKELRHQSSYFLSSKRSEEHTSELQSPDHLVCRLLLEKKKQSNDDKQQ